MIKVFLYIFSDLTEDTLFGFFLVALLLDIYLVISLLKAKKKMEKAADRLQKDTEIKASFLTHFIHALRLPLTSINDSCHKLEDGVDNQMPPEKREKIINNIHKNSHLLFSYMDEMQELSNFEGAVPAISMIEVNLAELIMSYRREILHETHRGVMVAVHTNMSPHCKATLNTTIFRQLIMHLLRLGAQRTLKGDITISYEWENEGLHFHLEDSGAPVSNEIIDLLFTDKLRSRHITHLDDKSTILSLNICKSIVDSMRGTISAMSREDDKGIAIDFWIPCFVRFS